MTSSKKQIGHIKGKLTIDKGYIMTDGPDDGEDKKGVLSAESPHTVMPSPSQANTQDDHHDKVNEEQLNRAFSFDRDLLAEIKPDEVKNYIKQLLSDINTSKYEKIEIKSADKLPGVEPGRTEAVEVKTDKGFQFSPPILTNKTITIITVPRKNSNGSLSKTDFDILRFDAKTGEFIDLASNDMSYDASKTPPEIIAKTNNTNTQIDLDWLKRLYANKAKSLAQTQNQAPPSVTNTPPGVAQGHNTQQVTGNSHGVSVETDAPKAVEAETQTPDINIAKANQIAQLQEELEKAQRDIIESKQKIAMQELELKKTSAISQVEKNKASKENTELKNDFNKTKEALKSQENTTNKKLGEKEKEITKLKDELSNTKKLQAESKKIDDKEKRVAQQVVTKNKLRKKNNQIKQLEANRKKKEEELKVTDSKINALEHENKELKHKKDVVTKEKKTLETKQQDANNKAKEKDLKIQDLEKAVLTNNAEIEKLRKKNHSLQDQLKNAKQPKKQQKQNTNSKQGKNQDIDQALVEHLQKQEEILKQSLANLQEQNKNLAKELRGTKKEKQATLGEAKAKGEDKEKQLQAEIEKLQKELSEQKKENDELKRAAVLTQRNTTRELTEVNKRAAAEITEANARANKDIDNTKQRAAIEIEEANARVNTEVEIIQQMQEAFQKTVEKIIQEKQDLEKKLQEAEQNNTIEKIALQEEVNQTTNNLEATGRENLGLNQENERVVIEIAEANAKISEVQNRLNEISKEAAEKQQALEKTIEEEKHKVREAEMRAGQAEIKAETAYQKKSEEAEKKADEAEKKAEEAEKRAAELEEQLTNAKVELENQKASEAEKVTTFTANAKQIEILQSQLEEAKKKIDGLNLALQTANDLENNKALDLHNQMNEMKEKIIDMQSEIEKQKSFVIKAEKAGSAAIEINKNQLADLQTAYDTLSRQNEQNVELLFNQRNELVLAKNKSKEAQRGIIDLTQKLASSNQANEELQTTLNQLQREQEALKNEKQALEKIKTDLEQQNQTLTAEKENLSKSNQELETQIAASQESNAEIEARHSIALGEIEMRDLIISQRILELTQKLKGKSQEIKDLKEKEQYHTDVAEGAVNKLKAEQEITKDQQKQIENITLENEALQKRTESAEEALKSTEQKLSVITEENQSIKEQNTALGLELRQSKEKTQSIQSELENAQKELANLELSKSEQQEELFELRKNILSLTEEKEKNSKEVETLLTKLKDNEIEQLKAKLASPASEQKQEKSVTKLPTKDKGQPDTNEKAAIQLAKDFAALGKAEIIKGKQIAILKENMDFLLSKIASLDQENKKSLQTVQELNSEKSNQQKRLNELTKEKMTLEKLLRNLQTKTEKRVGDQHTTSEPKPTNTVVAKGTAAPTGSQPTSSTFEGQSNADEVTQFLKQNPQTADEVREIGKKLTNAMEQETNQANTQTLTQQSLLKTDTLKRSQHTQSI